jgi:glycosyltransferase involved in cell wall biosynthesis
MTSLFEGTPMVLLEAMSSALPVVATSVDGIAEVCTDERDAFLVRDFCPTSFVSPILNLLRTAGPRNALGENARRTIESRYGIEVITRRVEGVYEILLSASGRDF